MLTKFQALGIQLVHNLYFIFRILKKHTMPRRHFEPKKSLGPKLSSYIAKVTTYPKCWVLRHKLPTFSTTTNYRQANFKMWPNNVDLSPNYENAVVKLLPSLSSTPTSTSVTMSTTFEKASSSKKSPQHHFVNE